MLVLTRKVNERISIGDDVEMIILGVRGNKVKIGLDAPEDVIILRSELLTDGMESNNGKGE